MRPSILPVVFLLLSAVAPARAQTGTREAMAAAFEMGRALLAIDAPLPAEPGEGARRAGEGLRSVSYEIPAEGHDARLREQLLESRLPLSPEAAVGDSFLVLIGDLPYLPQGRAWLIQNAAALKEQGITHLGFEQLRSDQQDAVDAYLAGRLARAELLARLLGDNDVRFPGSRRLAFEETVSAVDAAALAGLRVVALGLPEPVEDAAFRELTGRTRVEMRSAGRERYEAALRDVQAPLEHLRADGLAERIGSVLRDSPSSRLLALVQAARLSPYSTAGRLAQAGVQARALGFFFPESEALNVSLQKLGSSVRYSEFWAYVPLDRRSTGMDALLIAPAPIPQPPLR